MRKTSHHVAETVSSTYLRTEAHGSSVYFVSHLILQFYSILIFGHNPACNSQRITFWLMITVNDLLHTYCAVKNVSYYHIVQRLSACDFLIIAVFFRYNVLHVWEHADGQ